MKYRIRNWSEYQHYKKRNPPWIKLHFSLLSSPDWVMLDDESRVLAIACMLVASKRNGEIDGSERGLNYLKRVAYLHSYPDLQPLVDLGFIEPLQADASTLQADARPEESREEEETEKKETSEREKAPVSDMWEMWLRRFGGSGRQPTLTGARSKALQKLWDEQLKDEDEPFKTFSKVLDAVKASDHHMSKREYQYPDSLFRNDSRRDRWVDIAINGQVQNGDDTPIRGFYKR